MKYLRFWAIAIIGAVFAAPMALGDSQARKGSTEAEVIQQLDVLNSVVKELTTFYVDTLDAKKHIHTAIKAMMQNRITNVWGNASFLSLFSFTGRIPL